ncbi:MAG: alpha/beta hydrolase, partial [Cyclobacteriaceae bacterium]
EEALLNDAQKVYHYATKHFSFDKTVIYGRSLGTGIATKVAAENRVELLILESPYYSMLDLTNNWMPWLPQKWILKYPLRTDLYFTKVGCPVLVFHGDQDKTIYPGSSLKLSRSFKPGDELLLILGAGHNDIGLFPEYQEKLKEALAP